MIHDTNKAVLVLALSLLCALPAFATEWVKVTNRSGGTIKVKVWHGINAKSEVLKNGQNFTWKRSNTADYNVEVFEKEGRIVKTWRSKAKLKDVDYSSDVVIGKGPTIKPTAPRHTVFHNGSDVAIVVKVFHGADAVRLIPCDSLTIQPGKQATWRSTEDKFHVKVFELRNGFDKHVGTQVDIARPSKVTISNASGWDIAPTKM